MGLREFTDSRGTTWRVWDVVTDSVRRDSPTNRYLGEYTDGWLCFESPAERRRLASFPGDWLGLSDHQLGVLLDRAAPVPRRRGTPLDSEAQERR